MLDLTRPEWPARSRFAGRWETLRQFLKGSRAGATSIASVAAGVMAFGGGALITDHLWLINQRDLLKEAAAAGAMAATLEFRQYTSSSENIGQSTSCASQGTNEGEGDPPAETQDASPALAKLEAIATRYVRLNLVENLPGKDRERASDTLCVEVVPDVRAGTVDVTATAELGGPLLYPDFRCMVGQFVGVFGGGSPEECAADSSMRMQGSAGAERDISLTEVVLAIDMSVTMNLCLDWNDFFDCRDEKNGKTKDDVRMAIVKDAAQILVDILGPDENDPTVAVGLVPWHNTVRLGGTDAARWDSNGWAEYPQEKMYPLPYSLGSPVTRTMPAEPANEWRGCLDRRPIGGSSSPGLSTTTPSDSPVPKAFYPALGGHRGVDLRCADTPPRAGKRCYFGPWYSVISDNQVGCAATSPMLPLTSNATTIAKAIDDLTPVNGTRIASTHSALGVVWGHPDADAYLEGRLGGGVPTTRSGRETRASRTRTGLSCS